MDSGNATDVSIDASSVARAFDYAEIRADRRLPAALGLYVARRVAAVRGHGAGRAVLERDATTAAL